MINLFKFILSFLRSDVEAKQALSSATQHAMPPEFGEKWGKEGLDTSTFAFPAVCGIQHKADLI